jgi:hypothetical protein
MKKLLLAISILILMSMVSCGDLPETFKVIYYGNGSTSGFPPTDNKEYKSGEKATVLDENTLRKTGFEFSGWNTKEDNTGTHYNPGEQIEIKNINILLFPVWE